MAAAARPARTRQRAAKLPLAASSVAPVASGYARSLRPGEAEDGGAATIDVADVKAEAGRLKAANVDVGVVIELHGQMRLVDVFDPDGNRIQLAQELGEC